MSMTAAQFKGRLAELLEIPKKQADDVLWAVSEVMSEVVEAGDSLTIPGVGKLTCAVSPARKARNPATGESIMTKPKVSVKFRVSKTLKDKAPALKSKQGKALLAEAEEKQAKRDKAKRRREREEKSGTTKKGTTKNKSKKTSATKKNAKAKVGGRRF